jgi:hypothetical protein
MCNMLQWLLHVPCVQARMQNLKVQMDAPPEVAAGAAGAGGAAAGPGMLGTIGRVIKDALILGTVGTAGFVGYYTFAYNNVQVSMCCTSRATQLNAMLATPAIPASLNVCPPARKHLQCFLSVPVSVCSATLVRVQSSGLGDCPG